MSKESGENLDLIVIQKMLKKRLDAPRYQHTLGVTYTAAALAMVHGYDLKEAQTAGLLHDCAKCIPNKKKIKICEKSNIKITSYEKNNPFMLHAKVGALIAKKTYNVKSESILNSILWHTTGKPAMDMLEKIIYVADYIEPGRDRMPNLEKIRKTAFQNLDECVYLILKDCLEYLKSTDEEIDMISVNAFEYYSNLHNQT